VSSSSPVLVLGMHRSGTSAVTRVVSLLGIPTTRSDDLLPAGQENPAGYWESRSFTEFNERLLHDAWSGWATPPLEGDLAALAEDESRRSEARVLLRDIGADGASMIKDPRLCLLLPFWLKVLDEVPDFVVVSRHPVEVARSLARRDGLTISHGLALWERYTLGMLRDVSGRSAYVVDFETVLGDPDWVAELRDFLRARGHAVDDASSVEAAHRFLDVRHRHQVSSASELDEHCSRTQVALHGHLVARRGPHESLQGFSGQPTAWAVDLLSSRRGLYVANRRLEEQQLAIADEQNRSAGLAASLAAAQESLAAVGDEVERLRQEELQARAAQHRAAMEVEAAVAAADAARRAVDVMQASTSWRISAPVRALAPLKRAVDRRRSTGSLVRGTVDHFKREGVVETVRRVRAELTALPQQHADYAEWVARFDTLTPADRAAVEAAVAELDDPPLISVVMPVYNSDPQHLERAVESVRGQIYPYWQLCLADDASTKPETTAVLDRLALADNRITLVRREANGGIAEATNTALSRVEGDYVAFVDHDDELAVTALYVVAQALADDPALDLVYSDEDKIDEQGNRYEPYFKPDYNPELLLAQNYFNHLTVVRRELVEKAGGLRLDLEGAQDHDLVLRLVEATVPERIGHLPYVLYHWRQFGGATSFSREHADRAAAAGTRAVQEHLERTEQRARASVDPRTPGWQRVRWEPPDPLPEVTVVIPTRDRLPLLRTAVEGLLERTNYAALRVLVADNDSSEPETLEYLDSLRGGDRTDVLPVPGPFNYSAINNRAVEQVGSPLVLLLNNDIEVDGPDWLQEMVGLVSREGVGAVGAKLYYGNGSVQHAGVVLGIGGVAGHAHKYRPAHETGYFGRLVLTQEVAAVTGACLLTPTELWRRLGGLDEKNLSIAFNDVDYCLRVREAGHRVVWAANAELRHLESISRGREESAQQVARFNREAAWMRRRWGSTLQEDPTYSPNLTDVHEDYSLAHPPRVRKPWSR
jgi:GT2 family glycosyltransferase